MKPIRRLFIAEKPKLGRAIAACLDGPVQNFGDWIACGADAVTWCFGHLLSQLSPQQYDPALKSAVEHAEALKSAFPRFSVACIHGRMKAKEKDAIMADVVAGNIQILVSTTVIEVGVDVPNAA
ncbi:MAG: hypothetical protein II515_02330, partial [Desulfovibrio sp.]|nr:hypothetical protein [Desulfovibrio sp.]